MIKQDLSQVLLGRFKLKQQELTSTKIGRLLAIFSTWNSTRIHQQLRSWSVKMHRDTLLINMITLTTFLFILAHEDLKDYQWFWVSDPAGTHNTCSSAMFNSCVCVGGSHEPAALVIAEMLVPCCKGLCTHRLADAWFHIIFLRTYHAVSLCIAIASGVIFPKETHVKQIQTKWPVDISETKVEKITTWQLVHLKCFLGQHPWIPWWHPPCTVPSFSPSSPSSPSPSAFSSLSWLGQSWLESNHQNSYKGTCCSENC